MYWTAFIREGSKPTCEGKYYNIVKWLNSSFSNSLNFLEHSVIYHEVAQGQAETGSKIALDHETKPMTEILQEHN